MDRGIIKITKAKAWRDSTTNPNGMVRRFNLVGGWKFSPYNNDQWHKEEMESYSKAGVVDDHRQPGEDDEGGHIK